MKDTLSSNTQKIRHILREINITEWYFNQDGWMYNFDVAFLKYQLTIIQRHIRKQLYLPFVDNDLQMIITDKQVRP